MARVKRGVTSHARHKRLRQDVKGFTGLRKGRSIKKAREALFKALSYAYRDRRTRKRDFRALWIQRINAAARQNGLSYSQFMRGLSLSGNGLNRKMLAEIAFNQPEVFAGLAKEAQAALAKGPIKSPAKAETKEPAAAK
jgi:large subunit ribosomal protein L20